MLVKWGIPSDKQKTPLVLSSIAVFVKLTEPNVEVLTIEIANVEVNVFFFLST